MCFACLKSWSRAICLIKDLRKDVFIFKFSSNLLWRGFFFINKIRESFDDLAIFSFFYPSTFLIDSWSSLCFWSFLLLFSNYWYFSLKNPYLRLDNSLPSLSKYVFSFPLYLVFDSFSRADCVYIFMLDDFKINSFVRFSSLMSLKYISFTFLFVW